MYKRPISFIQYSNVAWRYDSRLGMVVEWGPTYDHKQSLEILVVHSIL